MALGWAIARKPQMFLYNEPLPNLDSALRMEIGAPSMNFPEAEVQSAMASHTVVCNAALDPVEVPISVGKPSRLGMRPPCLSPTLLGKPKGQLHGAVEQTELLGSETVPEVTPPNGKPLIAALTKDAVFAIGTALNLGFDPAMTQLIAD